VSDAEEAEGWTDLHLHPVDATWRPEPADLPEVLAGLGIEAVGVVTAHAVADEWDGEEGGDEPVAELEMPDLDAIAALAAREDVVHLSLLADPVACGYQHMLEALRSPRDPWRPCVLSFGWGPASVPDPQGQRTAARFACSLAIGGPGTPAKPVAAAKAVPDLPAVIALIERATTVFDRDCTARLVIG